MCAGFLYVLYMLELLQRRLLENALAQSTH